MESEICLHTKYKRPCIRIMCSSDRVIYSECGSVEPFLFRIGVIPGKIFSVHVLTCLA